MGEDQSTHVKVQPPSLPDARPVTSGGGAAAVGTSSDQRSARGAEPTGDRVTLSNGAAAAVASAHGEEKVTRSERLRRLEAQVRAGSYRPSPGTIAEAMLEAAELAQALDDDLGEC